MVVVGTLFALVATLGILAVIPLIVTLPGRLSRRAEDPAPSRVLVVALAGLVVGGCGALVEGVPTSFIVPVAALAGLFATIAALPMFAVFGPLRLAIFSLVATAAVFVPVSTVVFTFWFDPFATGLGAIDFGGALPALVAAGAVATAVLLLRRDLGTTGTQPDERGWWPTIWPALVLWAMWLLWLLGLELGIDAVSPVVLANGLMMPTVAAVVYVIVERIKHESTTPAAVTAGILSGLAAATPAVASLEPTLALVTAGIVAAVCAVLPRGGKNAGIRVVTRNLVVGGSLGLVLLGLFSRDIGLIYTGQPELIFTQFEAVALGAGLGFGVGALLWLALKPPSTR